MKYYYTQHNIILFLFFLVVFLYSNWIPSCIASNVMVIVNKDNPIAAMTPIQVSNLYLGKSRAFPDGSIAHVIEQSREAPLRGQFFRLINGMSLNQVNTFWARLSISGQVLPPTAKTDSEAVLKTVEDDARAIGYVDDSVLLGSKVVPVLVLHE